MSDAEIQNIFKSFDKDNSGTIQVTEIKEIAQALGEKLTQEQVTHIMKNIDVNGDGKISLSQFKYWWHNGLKGKLGDLVFLKAKSMKMTTDFLNKFNQAGVDINNYDKENSINVADFSLSVGEYVKQGMELNFSLYQKGDRFKWEFNILKERGINWLNEKSINILLMLPTNNAAKTKEELFALLKGVADSGMFPFLDLENDNNPYMSFKFKPIDKFLVLHIEIKEGLAALFEAPLNQFDTIEANFDDSFYLYIKSTLRTNFTIDQLLQSDNILETVLKGFYFNICGEAPNCVLKKFREVMEAGGRTDSPWQFLLTVLLKNVFLNLKMKSPAEVEKFYEKIGIKEILGECPNLSDLLQQFSLLPEIQNIKFVPEHPGHILYKFLKCFKSNINAGLQVYVHRQKTLMCLKTDFPQAHKIYNVIFNEV